MEIKQVKLSELVKPEKNVRIHTDKQLDEFERSVTMFGQIRPIVIDENNVIMAGNGLYDTLIRMGKDTADVYQYKDLTENQKKKLMIADNKIFSLGIENLETLNDFLEELSGDLDIPGFDEDILQQMVADAEEVTERISEYGTIDDEEIRGIQERGNRQPSLEPENSDFGSNAQEGAGSGVVIPTSERIQEEQNDETTEVKKFVVCPKCGEKIWL